MYQDRLNLLKNIENRRRSRVILYVTGDRAGLETEIHAEVYDYFAEILERFGDVNRISLILYTRGGDTLTAWSLVNLIKQYCKRFEVILPGRAFGAGTLITLGADRIVMAKQAALGCIDTSVDTPLNPRGQKDSRQRTLPVSMEAIHGYLDFAMSQIGEHEPHTLKELILRLTEEVHPLVLGEAYRSATQVQTIATRLLESSGLEETRIESIVSLLCAEPGSHDYVIHRSEAHAMGLPVEKPHELMNSDIKALYADFADELGLRQPWNPAAELGDQEYQTFCHTRCLLESSAGKSWHHLTEGEVLRHDQEVVEKRTFEGWKPESID